MRLRRFQDGFEIDAGTVMAMVEVSADGQLVASVGACSGPFGGEPLRELFDLFDGVVPVTTLALELQRLKEG